MGHKSTNTDIDFLSYIEEKISLWKEIENLDGDKFDNLVGDLMRDLVQDWGGQNIYVKQSGYLSRRDQEIFNEYDHKPETIKKLAKKYNRSEQWIYFIVKAEQKNLVERTQRKLL